MNSSHIVEQHHQVCIFADRAHPLGTRLTGRTEFTPHQRDVFCVFSGTMVPKFRDFLNNSPKYEALRESVHGQQPGYYGMRHRMTAQATPAAPPAFAANVEGDAADDETYDDDNDDTLDAAPPIDPNAFGIQPFLWNDPNAAVPNTFMTPDGQPFSLAGASSLQYPPPVNSLPNSQAPMHPYFGDPALGPLSFSSFMSNAPAVGAPPLSAHGHVQASIASLNGQQSSQTVNGTAPNGASAAPMHHPHHHAPEEEP